MKFVVLPLLLFGGILKLASCDKMLCLQDTVRLCAVTLRQTDPTHYSLDELCKSGVTTCLQNALNACEVHDPDDVNAFLDVMKHICIEGSDLNKKFIKHSDCLSISFQDSSTKSCADEIKAASKDLEPTPESMLKFLKKLCVSAPKSLTCFYGKIEAACSKDAKELLSAVGNPIMKLFQKSCDELNNKDGGGVAGISALSWMIFAAISILMFIWH